MSQAANQDENSGRYPGWTVTGSAFVGVMVSFAPIIPFTFSLFLDPLHAEFGWKRKALSGGFALAAMTVAFVSPLIGLLLDRFPPRRIILPAICVFAIALASLSGLGPSITRFYFTYFIIGLAANGTAQFAYTRTVLTWFHRHRGMALALILTGSGVGSLFFPPLTQWIIETHGWRSAYLTLGGIALLGLPLTAIFVRNRPETMTFASDNQNRAGASVGEALRSYAFWILLAIVMFGSFSENGIITNLAAILTEHGINVHLAALALSVRGGAGIIGRLGVGFLLDRFSPQRLQTIILFTSAVGITLLAFASSPAVSFVGSALLGIGLGSEADIAPYLMARYFGRRHFSMLYGLSWTAYAIGGATGPLTLGHLYDRAGSYQPQLILLVGAATLAAALLSLVLRDKGARYAQIELAATDD